MAFSKKWTNLVKRCAVDFPSDAHSLVKNIQQLACDAKDK